MIDFFGINQAIEFVIEQRKWRERTDKYFYEKFKESSEENEKWINKILNEKETNDSSRNGSPTE